MNSMLQWLDENAGHRHGNYIDGAWEEAGARATEIRNPARKEQVLGSFAASDASDVDHAVNAAEAALRSWRKIPGPRRGAILFRAADLLEQRAQEIAFTLSAEQGKVLAESFGEVARAVSELRFCAGEAARMDGTTFPSEKEGALAMTLHEPLGVVAAIAPWNFPVVTPVRKIGPALAYGCTVVLKVSQLTPWSAVNLMSVFQDAGVPGGVLNLVLGSGSEVGDALVAHPGISGVSFTGSTGVGSAINTAAAPRFVRTQLEMGGKNPAVVLGYRDASQVAAQITAAAFACSGQRCTALSRVIVLESLHSELMDALTASIRAIKAGPAWDSASTMGPLITAEHRDSVLQKLSGGLQQGGRVLIGGNALDAGDLAHGHFMEPTLVDRVDPQGSLAREELFGPVLSVVVASDAQHALEIANSTNYGLASSLFTENVGEALEFINACEAGMIHVNHGTASEAHVPFGGVKDSGFGAWSIGHSNQQFFTKPKAVYIQQP